MKLFNSRFNKISSLKSAKRSAGVTHPPIDTHSLLGAMMVLIQKTAPEHNNVRAAEDRQKQHTRPGALPDNTNICGSMETINVWYKTR
jgi:hypothetical protein